ncbi:MAG TPA: sialidase family protein [Gemmatimonadales bacterium]|nr:sialidase family protein [Gemmatimonadales bacterium]
MSAAVALIAGWGLLTGSGGASERAFTQATVPAAPGSLAPVLSGSADGRLVLSWLEPAGKAHALRFSMWRDAGWTRPLTVMSSDSLFVNWADVPSVVPAGGDTLVAHWLRKTASGTYDYGVRLARSVDGGRTWSEPLTPHRDGLTGEHGFASLLPWPGGGTAAVWLDGRGMTAHGEDPTQSMTLRHAVLEPSGERGAETLLDARTCECCQTGAALAGDAVVVVYRDRSEREIRDIFSVRWQDGQWSDPVRVAADGWHMPGCPVNGPAIAASGRDVVVAWFTAPAESARVNVVWSRDGGRSYGAPVRVDEGAPTGRADVTLLPDGSAAVCWIEGTGKDAAVRARRVRADGTLGAGVTIARTSAARRAGFPRLVSLGERLVCAWTDPAEPTRIRSARAGAAALPR